MVFLPLPKPSCPCCGHGANCFEDDVLSRKSVSKDMKVFVRRVQLDTYPVMSHSSVDVASSPTLDSLKPERKELMHEMRSRLDKLQATKGFPKRHDLWLKRFLQHAKWKVDKATDKYLSMEEWRQKIGADQIIRNDPEGMGLKTLPLDVSLFLPYSLCVNHRMIAVMQLGLVPWWRPIFEPVDQLLKSQIWTAEDNLRWVSQNAEDTGVWCERYVVLMDLRHINWPYLSGVLSSSRAQKRAYSPELTTHYPGIIDKAFIFNAPTFVNKIWAVLKMVLGAALLEKASIVSDAESQMAMLDELGAENVPRCFGGFCDAPTLGFPSHLRTDQMPSEGSWDAIIAAWKPREIEIPAGKKFEEVVIVPARKRLLWHWALLDLSIVFKVEKKSLGSFEIVKSKEFDFTGTQDPEIDELRAGDVDCEVRFSWDNSGSRMRSKHLLLRLEVL